MAVWEQEQALNQNHLHLLILSQSTLAFAPPYHSFPWHQTPRPKVPSPASGQAGGSSLSEARESPRDSLGDWTTPHPTRSGIASQVGAQQRAVESSRDRRRMECSCT